MGLTDWWEIQTVNKWLNVKTGLLGEGPGAWNTTPLLEIPLSNFTRDSFAWRDLYVGNVIMFFESDRRLIKPSLSGSECGEGEGTGHCVFRKTNQWKGRVFPWESHTRFATPAQEYTRAKHCILVLQVPSAWSRIAFSALDETACHCGVEYSWRVLRIRVGC